MSFVCLNETKLDKYDCIDVNGDNFVCSSSENARIRGGGIWLLYKSNCDKYVQRKARTADLENHMESYRLEIESFSDYDLAILKATGIFVITLFTR